MNFTKIRKNASKKIASLIAESTFITIETKSMGLDDSWNSNGDSEIESAEVFTFMEDNYSDLQVRLHSDESGNVVSLTIQDGPYYFSDMITVHFTAKPVQKIEVTVVESAPVKIKMTFKQVQSMLKAGFISPLQHGVKRSEDVADEDKSIVSIKVIWSESRAFNKALPSENFDINKRISLEEYNRLSWLTLAEQKRFMNKTGEGYGYDKTKVELTLGNGQVCTYRHDICIKEPTLQSEWASWVDYCRAEEDRKTAVMH